MLFSFRPLSLILLFAFVTIAACHAHEPPRGPEETCVQACIERAKVCSESECIRGCNLVIDRLVEREGGNVLACVAKKKKDHPCNDALWANCATRIGAHADGGPPPPPLPEEIEE